MTRRVKKWVGSLCGSGLLFVLILGACYWVVVSGRANGLIREYLEGELSVQMDMVCKIGHIEGNPLGRYRVMDVALGDMLSVDTIGVRYHPVFAYRVTIDSLLLKGLHVHLPQGQSSDAPPDLALLRTFVPIAVNHLTIDRGHVYVSPEVQVVNQMFRGGFFAEGNEFKLVVSQYQSQQFDPPLELTNLSGVGILAGGEIALKDVGIALPQSALFVTGQVGRLDRLNLDLTFRASPLHFSDLKKWLGEEAPPVAIDFAGSVKGDMTNGLATVSVQFDSSQVDLNVRGSFVPLNVDVRAEVMANNLTPHVVWDVGSDVNLTGRAEVTAQVDSVGVKTGKLNARIERFVLDGIAQGETVIDVAYEGGSVTGNVTSMGDVGNVSLSGQYDLNQQVGRVQAGFQNLAVALLPQMPPSLGKMTGHVSVVKDSVWKAQVQLNKAMYDAVQIRDLNASLLYAGDRLLVDKFEIDVPEFATCASGQAVLIQAGFSPQVTGYLQGYTGLKHVMGDSVLGDRLSFETTFDARLDSVVTGNAEILAQLDNFNGGLDSLKMDVKLDHKQNLALEGDIWGHTGRIGLLGALGEGGDMQVELNGLIRSLTELSHLSPYTVAGDSLKFGAKVSGTLDAPKVGFDASIAEVVVDDIPIENLSLSGRWDYPNQGAISARIDTLSWGTRNLNGIFLDADYQGDRTAFLFGSNANQDDKVYVWGAVETDGQRIRVVADSLHLQAAQVALSNQGPLLVEYDADRGFHIGNFELVGPAGRVVAQDHPNFKSAIEVLLSDIDLRPWAFLFGQPQVGGILNAEFAFSGDLTDPLVFAEGHIKDVDLFGLRVPKITSNFSYGDLKVLVDVVVSPSVGKPLSISGSIPIDPNEQMQLALRSGGLSAALLDTFLTGVNDIGGDLVVQLNVAGTPNAPTYAGQMKWVDGRIDYASVGRVHEPIFASLSLDQNTIRLDTLTVGKAGQQLTGVGRAMLHEGDLSEFDVRLNFVRFQPIRWPEVKAEFSGDLHLQGTPSKPRLDGNMLVQQADIRLGELMATPSSGWEQWPFIQALQMAMSVRIDQQVWVRDPTFNIEMVGDLDVVKDLDGFKVFGNMQSRRGNYVFQNRRFDITRGEILFQGNTVIDPNLDIEAQTRVMARLGATQGGASNDGRPEPVTVTVNVGGTLIHPEIKLASDPVVGQFDDILSVLLVGATRDVVAVTNASDFVLGALANRFGQRLGDDLKLDLVEVDVAESNISRVRVGKYLTPRLFVSYAQDMGSTGREIAVEFQLMRNLTLEAKQIDAGQEEQLIQQTRESIGIVWEKEW